MCVGSSKVRADARRVGQRAGAPSQPVGQQELAVSSCSHRRIPTSSPRSPLAPPPLRSAQALSAASSFFCLRDYRGEVPKGSAEIFRKVKFCNDEAEEAPPVFNVDGVNYIHVKVAGLFFVVTTMVNVSPSLLLELLQRIARVTKDYLGILNEDSLRKNFILVFKLLDKVVDLGYLQTSNLLNIMKRSSPAFSRKKNPTNIY